MEEGSTIVGSEPSILAYSLPKIREEGVGAEIRTRARGYDGRRRRVGCNERSGGGGKSAVAADACEYIGANKSEELKRS
ncbi:hypothetical protein N9L76_01565 [bacterium]|nr:hypothetical protein [bacterium]